MALHEKTIRYTPIRYLNDPFECRPAGISPEESERMISEAERARLDPRLWQLLPQNNPYFQLLSKEELDEMRENPRAYLQEVFDRLSERMRHLALWHEQETGEFFTVASFSKGFSNLLMWSHYAEQHKGIVIGYDTRCFRRLFPTGTNFVPVCYSVERYSIPLDLESQLDVLEAVVTTKAKVWEYEDEWRSVVLDNNKNTLMNGYRTEQLLPHEIQEIYIGVCATDETRDVCRELCKANPQYKLYQMEFHKTNYELTYRSI